MKRILLLLIILLFNSCELYSVVDITESPMIVEQQLSTNDYRVSYYYGSELSNYQVGCIFHNTSEYY